MINVNAIDDLPDVSVEVGEELAAAGLRLAEAAKGLWISVAQQMGVHNTGAYIRGIRAEGNTTVKVGQTGDVWTVDVVIINTAHHASYVEDGHEAFHLPEKIDWSGPRVKHGANGPYLHIPMRHSAYVEQSARAEQGVTPQALRRMMPREVYGEAKALARRIPLREGPIRSPAGKFLAADRYAWQPGDEKKAPRLTGRPGAAFVASSTGEIFEERRGPRGENPGWGASRFEGLFKSGPPGHTSYMTIRTITPRSAGFHIPAQAPKPVIATVERLIGDTPEFGQLIEDVFTAKAGVDAL